MYKKFYQFSGNSTLLTNYVTADFILLEGHRVYKNFLKELFVAKSKRGAFNFFMMEVSIILICRANQCTDFYTIGTCHEGGKAVTSDMKLEQTIQHSQESVGGIIREIQKFYYVTRCKIFDQEILSISKSFKGMTTIRLFWLLS